MRYDVEKKAVVLVVSAECPVTNFGEDGTREINTDYALDLPHEIRADSEASDLAANCSVKGLVEIVATAQSNVRIEPVILS